MAPATPPKPWKRSADTPKTENHQHLAVLRLTGDVDFLLVSHAEQDLGDFPLQLGDADQLLDQMRDAAHREMGILTTSSAILFWDGSPVAGYIDSRPLQNETSRQALRSLFASFIVQGTGIERMAQRAIVEDLLEGFRIPTFG